MGLRRKIKVREICEDDGREVQSWKTTCQNAVTVIRGRKPDKSENSFPRSL